MVRGLLYEVWDEVSDTVCGLGSTGCDTTTDISVVFVKLPHYPVTMKLVSNYEVTWQLATNNSFQTHVVCSTCLLIPPPLLDLMRYLTAIPRFRL